MKHLMRHRGDSKVGGERLQRVLDVERGARVPERGGGVRELQRALGRRGRRQHGALALQRAAHAREQLGEAEGNGRSTEAVQLLEIRKKVLNLAVGQSRIMFFMSAINFRCRLVGSSFNLTVSIDMNRLIDELISTFYGNLLKEKRSDIYENCR